MFVLRITKIRPFKSGYWHLFLKVFFFVITGLVKGDDVFNDNDNDKKKNKNEVDNNTNSDNNNDNDITY